MKKVKLLAMSLTISLVSMLGACGLTDEKSVDASTEQSTTETDDADEKENVPDTTEASKEDTSKEDVSKEDISIEDKESEDSVSENNAVEDGVSEENDENAQDDASIEDTNDTSKVEKTFDYSDINNIAAIGGLKASCQTNDNKCVVNVDFAHNPYDVKWDYGDTYNDYVTKCDWSLVFDADYYMKTFPLLAMLYHYDEDLLLEHFQTVGVHEGRQGSADFNLGAYYTNCNIDIYRAFEHNYECYYIYYMLHYDTEKNVNTVFRNDGKDVHVQYDIQLTKLQSLELKGVNGYRTEVGAEKLIYDSEAIALANYRAYLNAHDEWEKHDWFKSDANWYTVTPYLGTDRASENTLTGRYVVTRNRFNVPADSYRTSDEHYKGMIDTRAVYLGSSNLYTGCGSDGAAKTSQFDMFFPSELATSTIWCAGK